MLTRIESQPAYILHTRHFRDSSVIAECLTAHYGRVSGVVKGVRANSKSAKQRRGSTQPLVPLLVSWSGKTELKTFTGMEARAAPIGLQGRALFSALYVNELLTRLLLPGEEHTELFVLYEWTLKNLLNDPLTDVVLRRFELQLLNFLGYGLDFGTDMTAAAPIMAGALYCYHPEQGFTQAAVQPDAARDAYRGEDLLAIGAGRFSDPVRRVARQLCRQALAFHLGNKPLKSRELFK